MVLLDSTSLDVTQNIPDFHAPQYFQPFSRKMKKKMEKMKTFGSAVYISCTVVILKVLYRLKDTIFVLKTMLLLEYITSLARMEDS